MGTRSEKNRWFAALGFLLAFGVSQASECLNSIPPSNPDLFYQVQGDVVTDSRTGLMWKRCSEGQSWSGSTCVGTASVRNWTDALQLAEASTFAGYSDWRLPNLKELRSLVEECRVNPAINVSIFPSTPGMNFWTSSPYAGSSSGAWYVFFGNGYGNTGHTDRVGNTLLVRLVRDAQ